jgi:D-glycero-alpha-D-manno-heptose-7-phosphate kinase
LRVRRETINELEHNLLLCYSGTTRTSDGIIEAQIRNYQDQSKDTIDAMDRLKSLTIEMKKKLLTSDLTEFGVLLHEAWVNKCKMASQISNARLDELYQVARRAGALGGKISGAGGGGYMFFYCPDETKYKVAEELEKLGAQVVDFTFDPSGMQSWRVQ